jgi:hypothetical protein
MAGLLDPILNPSVFGALFGSPAAAAPAPAMQPAAPTTMQGASSPQELQRLALEIEQAQQQAQQQPTQANAPAQQPATAQPPVPQQPTAAPPLPPPVNVGMLHVAPPPATDMMPTGSTPAAPQGQPSAQSPVPDSSLLGRLGGIANGFGNFANNHSLTLMALGAGLAGAPSIGAGVSRGLAAAVPAAQAEQKLNQKNQGIAQSYKALVGAGVPAQEALAAVYNPDIMKAVAAKYIEPKSAFGVIGKDMFGNETYGFNNPSTGEVTLPKNSPAAVPGAPGAVSGNSAYLAKGVNAVDSNLTGEDYLKQFSPEIQSAVKSYVGGESMPTGNPRAGYTQAIKTIAQKYGNDVGLPADDTSFTARKTMRNNLSVATAGSLGGQINSGNTALGHLADMSQKALDLGNVDLGNTWLTQGANYLRGLKTDQAAKVGALQTAAQHVGQEITKFYAGSPGGESERQSFLERANAAKSPQELAAVIETESELMKSRLSSIDSQIKGTLGPMSDKYPVVRPESQKAIDVTTANVARLRGGAPAVAAPAASQQQPQQAASPLTPGRYRYDPASGQMVPMQ